MIYRWIIIGILLLPELVLSQAHWDWSYNLNIYQVNTRQYTTAGTFNQFASHLDRLEEMGVGIIYFMPIHPIGTQNRIGSLGSPYSVYDYRSINAEFGTMEDFTRLVDSIHARGMYVIIDWVANHTAWDNPLTISHPEWYVTDDNGNFTLPPGTNWSDVIQLDYSNHDLRNYMIESMEYWISEADVDGFRCDAVSFMPLDFWSEAIADLKAIKPELLMVAEDDGTQYKSVGFDLSYAWGYHGFGDGILKRIVNGFSNASALDFYLISEWYHYYPDHTRLYFTSNHDENAWHGTVFEQFGDAAESFTVLTSLLSGMQMIYGGQEAGLSKRLAFFDKDAITWQSHPFSELYTTLLHLKRTNEALWNGERGGPVQRIQTDDDENVFAFIRWKSNERIMAVFNLTSVQDTVILKDSLSYGPFHEVFTGEAVVFEEETQIILGPWDYKVFEQDDLSTSIENPEIQPDGFLLHQNYPNPFNPITKIRYEIPEQTQITMTIHDVQGREVAVLQEGMQSPGAHVVYWNGSSRGGRVLETGIYFVRLDAGEFGQTIKMLYLK